MKSYLPIEFQKVFIFKYTVSYVLWHPQNSIRRFSKYWCYYKTRFIPNGNSNAIVSYSRQIIRIVQENFESVASSRWTIVIVNISIQYQAQAHFVTRIYVVIFKTIVNCLRQFVSIIMIWFFGITNTRTRPAIHIWLQSKWFESFFRRPKVCQWAILFIFIELFRWTRIERVTSRVALSICNKSHENKYFNSLVNRRDQ